MFPDLPSDRRLTDAERRQLAELERRLTESDPGLTRSFGTGSPGGSLTRPVLAVYAVAAAAMLLVAAIVGGVGGAAAVAVALVLTVAALVLPKRLRRRPKAEPKPPQAKKTAS
jgi:Flp pilus assembly protein TadB